MQREDPHLEKRESQAYILVAFVGHSGEDVGYDYEEALVHPEHERTAVGGQRLVGAQVARHIIADPHCDGFQDSGDADRVLGLLITEEALRVRGVRESLLRWRRWWWLP